jgi:hypothetical protein
MTYTKQTWVEDVTPTSAANMQRFEQGIWIAEAPLVTALPSAANGWNGLGEAPVDGSKIAYLVRDGSNNPLAIWEFIYVAAETGAFKWYFKGGSALLNEGNPNTDQTTATTWIAQAGTASITVPLAGDYDVRHGHWHWHTATGGVIYQDAVAANNTRAAGSVGQALHQTGVGSGEQYSVTSERRIAGVAAGAVINLQTWISAATGKIRNNWMRVQPYRVG